MDIFFKIFCSSGGSKNSSQQQTESQKKTVKVCSSKIKSLDEIIPTKKSSKNLRENS